MKRSLLPLLFALLTFSAVSFSQSLHQLLPSGTVLALGTEGLQNDQRLLQPFLDEFERLDVAGALESLMDNTDVLTAEVDDADITEEMRALELLDILGQEAWMSVSMAPNSPLPTVTAVARVSDKARQALTNYIAKQAARAEVQTLTEGGLTFYVETLATDDATASTPAAFAQDGNLIMVSSNVDALRGVLRRHQGANEPSFISDDGYAATLDTLGSGTFYSYLDLSPLGSLARTFLAGQGFGDVATRLESALQVAGVTGSVVRLSNAGMESHVVQHLGDASLDPALHALLASPSTASSDPLSFAPATALSVQSGNVNLVGWWDYLTDLIESIPELGIADVDQMIGGMTGLDLRASLFDWTGQHTAAIVTGAQGAVQPGVPSSNLLGESVYLVQATDEAAAASGLGNLFATITNLVGSMTSVTGDASAAQPATHDVGGVAVTEYVMGPGISISVAVHNGYALIATSADAMDEVLAAKANATKLPAALDSMRSLVPTNATTFTIADQKTALTSTAGQLSSQVQMLAGIGGASGLDFDAVEASSSTLEAFLAFVATKLDGAASYSQVDGNTITTTGTIQVDW